MKPWHIISLIIALAASFIGGYHCHSVINQKLIADKDTFIRVDTVRDSIPYPIIERDIELIPEPFPEYITLSGDTVHDTIFVSLPYTQRQYKNHLYHAYVSGYNPSLDSIEVYRTTEYITRKQRRFGLGVIAGYGVGVHGFSPYVGIGIYYRIW